MNSGCGNTAYTWNAEEQMSCGAGATYTYDGDGGRVKKTGGSSTPTMYWGGEAGDALAESDTSGNLTSEYIVLNRKRIARRDLSSGTVYYYFSDMLGSSNVVTTAQGGILNESDYYPFGGERIVTQSLSNQHYKFTGKERDAESGNDYFGARYYSSTMGRFMSPDWSAKEDPVPYAQLDDPQSLNLYSYVRNNPLTRVDADGHCLEDACALEGVSAAAVGAVIVGTAALVGIGKYFSTPSGQRSFSTFTSATSESIHSQVQSVKDKVTSIFNSDKKPGTKGKTGSSGDGSRRSRQNWRKDGGKNSDTWGR